MVLTEGSDLISFNSATGAITVNEDGKTGTAKITITVDDGECDSAQIPVTVTVICPEATVDTPVEYCVDENKVNGGTWEALVLGGTIFEEGSSQNGKDLTYSGGKFSGITVNGTATAPITIRTNKGLVTFTNIDGYTAVLTNENIFSKLDPATSPRGYYILKSNVTADFQSRAQGSYTGTGGT